MKTAEMVLAASESNKTYRCVGGDMIYNLKYGFCESDGIPWTGKAFTTVNDIFKLNWAEVKDIMTREEAEKKFNIIILD